MRKSIGILMVVAILGAVMGGVAYATLGTGQSNHKTTTPQQNYGLVLERATFTNSTYLTLYVINNGTSDIQVTSFSVTNINGAVCNSPQSYYGPVAQPSRNMVPIGIDMNTCSGNAFAFMLSHSYTVTVNGRYTYQVQTSSLWG